LTIAAAVPKAARADWMIEKLSELGTDIFIPLIAQRSVVVPQGKGKMDRWRRLAEESARQSGRQGVMTIEPVTPLEEILKHRKDLDEAHWVLSIDDGATSIISSLAAMPAKLTVLIGPEGGWTPGELTEFAAADIHPMRLTDTILRVETAAVAVAAIVKLSR
jgi:16S rRNA (uracil1498-N3)-methyltransferase